MPSLRDNIKKYEARTGTKIKSLGLVRCLYCPMSFFGCKGAKRMIRQEGKSDNIPSSPETIK